MSNDSGGWIKQKKIRTKLPATEPIFCDSCGQEFKTKQKVSSYNTLTGQPTYYILKDHGIWGQLLGCNRLYESHDNGLTWNRSCYLD